MIDSIHILPSYDGQCLLQLYLSFYLSSIYHSISLISIVLSLFYLSIYLSSIYRSISPLSIVLSLHYLSFYLSSISRSISLENSQHFAGNGKHCSSFLFKLLNNTLTKVRANLDSRKIN